MDLQQLIAQFFDDDGQIALPEHFTLPSLSETIYQAHLATGGGDLVDDALGVTEVVDDDLHATLRQCQGVCPAESATGSGDDRDLSCHVLHEYPSAF